jgi:8-amino-7-oxononanoate synthase
VLNVCSNDYLALAGDPRVGDAAKRAIEEFGSGAGAARLIVGNLGPHASLERALAKFTETDVLLFSSGWHANLGTLPVLAGEGDLIVSDKLNHASLIDGSRLSRADVGVFPHGDVTSVQRALERSGTIRRRLIVTESLFSMDGDLARLKDLFDLAVRYDAFLYVDEAHAIGVLGPDGKGACAAAGIPLSDPHLIRMGTLGKSLGSYGAFVAAAPEVITLLKNRSRGFIFTTAIPPSAAAAAEKALEISIAEPERRTRLLHRSAALRAMLASQGWEVGSACAQIVPLPIGDADETMAASRTLLEKGIYCQGIRPPTVPRGTSRLRVSLTAGHTDAHLTMLVRELAALTEARREAQKA